MVASFVLRTGDSVELIERRAYEGRQADRLKKDKTGQPVTRVRLVSCFPGGFPPSFKGFSVTVFLSCLVVIGNGGGGWWCLLTGGGTVPQWC